MAMEQRTRRRPLSRQEQLALQERKQHRMEKMEESRELAKGPIDVTFCLLVLLLTAIGLVMLLSASFPSAYYEASPSKHNPLYYFERQAIFAVLGTAVMLLVSKFNYQRLRGVGKILLYISVVLLLLVLIPGIGELIGGSQREEDYDKLVTRMDELGLDKSSYDLYLNLRKFGGVEHAGYGLGFERMIMYLTGIQNIRDVLPFPRTAYGF